MTRLPVALLIILLTAACTTPPPTGGNPALDSIAAQSTISVANELQRQAAESTRQSSEATGQAIAAAQQATQQAGQQATSVAVATAAQVTADVHSLSMAATAQSLTLDATATAYSMASTAQAVQAVATMEAGIVADEARRLEIQRQAEIAAIERGRQWATILQAVVVILAIAVAALIAVLAYRLYQRSRPSEVRQVGDRILVLAGNNVPYQIAAPTISRPETPLLPAGEPVARPSQLPPLATGHVLIAGETGSGKSTAMRAVLAARNNVTVLDPHSAGNDWNGAEVIGAGRNFDAISEYMAYMKELLETRYSSRANGNERFPPITVATDEMPAIVAAVGKDIEQVWREWLREGRKVGLYFVVSTQSTRVRTLGIQGEGDLLENFAGVIVLGQVAQNEYPDLCQGMERPAVLRTIRGVQPVVIPHHEARPSTTNGNGNHQPFVLPAPVYADPENMTIADRRRILYMLKEGFSQRAIERDVYGYNGGKAYAAVKQVKDEYESDVNVGGVVLGAN